MILCDTNILIEYYQDNPIISDWVIKNNIGISAVTYMEILYGAFNKRELVYLQKELDSLIVYEISHTFSSKARELIAKYTLSHNLDMPDALIAATALELKLPLYTLNTKHFQYISEIDLYAE